MFWLCTLADSTPLSGSKPWMLELARTLWDRNEHDLARHVASQLLDHLQAQLEAPPASAALRGQTLCIYGQWLAAARSHAPSVVIDSFLQPAVDSLTAAMATGSCLAVDALEVS